MENWMYGFDSNICQYSMREILFYLLFFSLMIYFSGKNMEKDAIRGRYFKLIRYNKYSIWWRSVCLRAFWRNILLVAFAMALYFLSCDNGIHMEDTLHAISLWLPGLVTLNMFQFLLVSSNHGIKIIFPIIMVIEILSVYGMVFGKDVVKFLPGSFLMLRRSSFMAEGGFTWTGVVLVQLLFDVYMFIFGYKIHRREMA